MIFEAVLAVITYKCLQIVNSVTRASAVSRVKK